MKQTKKTVSEDWITYLGGVSREPVGRVAPYGKGSVTTDLLGRERSGAVDRLEAGKTLDELGIHYLVTPYELVTDSGISEAHIARATPDFVRVKGDDFNDINSDQTFYILLFPVSEELLRELPGR